MPQGNANSVSTPRKWLLDILTKYGLPIKSDLIIRGKQWHSNNDINSNSNDNNNNDDDDDDDDNNNNNNNRCSRQENIGCHHANHVTSK